LYRISQTFVQIRVYCREIRHSNPKASLLFLQNPPQYVAESSNIYAESSKN
jgi:hypothetical protein